MYPFGTRALLSWAGRPLPCKQKGPALQDLYAMELAGLEPATSWVRSRRSLGSNPLGLQDF
jgi:hypothetical protein